MKVYIKLSNNIKNILADSGIDIEDPLIEDPLIEADFEVSIGIIPSVLKKQRGHRTRGSDLVHIITVDDESQVKQVVVIISDFLNIFAAVHYTIEQEGESAIIHYSTWLVYVDEARWSYRGALYCHMIADSDEELERFARRLGLRPEWKHKEHYDLAPSKREKALLLGAVELGARSFLEKWRPLRKAWRKRDKQ